jgi:hypothetical protein
MNAARKVSAIVGLFVWCVLSEGAFGQLYQPTSLTYKDRLDHQHIYNFLVKYTYSNTPQTSNLYMNYWDGFGWRWADQGLPNGVRTSPDHRMGERQSSGANQTRTV